MHAVHVPVDKEQEQRHQEKECQQSQQKLDLQMSKIIAGDSVKIITAGVQYILHALDKVDCDHAGRYEQDNDDTGERNEHFRCCQPRRSGQGIPLKRMDEMRILCAAAQENCGNGQERNQHIAGGKIRKCICKIQAGFGEENPHGCVHKERVQCPSKQRDNHDIRRGSFPLYNSILS